MKRGIDKEISSLERYLKEGGKLLLSMDVQLNGDVFEGLRTFLSEKGVESYNHLVFDLKRFVSGSKGSIPIVSRFEGKSPITDGFNGQVFFPVTSHFSWTGEREEVEIKSLAYSSDKSWGEKRVLDFVTGEQSFNRGEDVMGPLDLVISWEHKQDKSKMIVFGNSSFISNSYQRFGSHFTFFLNSLSWLVNEKGIISFDLPSVDNSPIFVSQHQLGVIFYISVILVPLLLMGLACYFYLRRRRG